MTLKKTYLLVLIGGFGMLCQGCKNNSTTPSQAKIPVLPIDLQTEIIQLKDDAGPTIIGFQYFDGRLYYKFLESYNIVIMEADLNSKVARQIINWDMGDLPFEINTEDYDFHFRKTSQGASTELAIVEEKQKMHHFVDLEYSFSSTIPKFETFCSMSTGIRDYNYPVIRENIYTPSSCEYGQNRVGWQRSWRTFIGFPINQQSSPHDLVAGGPFPPEYNDKLLPINALVEISLRTLNEEIWVNFPFGRHIYRYRSQDGTLIDSIYIPSAMVKLPGSMSKSSFNDPYDEFFFYSVSGYYSNFVILSDKRHVVRFAYGMGAGYESAPVRTQGDKFQNILDYRKKLMLVYDLHAEKLVGEYVLTDLGLNTEIAFEHNNHLYFHYYNPDVIFEDQLAFKTLSISDLLALY